MKGVLYLILKLQILLKVDINWILYQYNSLHKFQYDPHWSTLKDQYRNHIEISANCHFDYHI